MINFKERFPKFKKRVIQSVIGMMLITGPAIAYNSGDLPAGSNIGGHLVATLANKLSDFASTTSAQLRSVISDSTGTGSLVFATNPTIASPTITGSITGNLTGNASTATALQTARTINGVSFDGTGNITAPAAAGTLTGSTLASGVTASSLTSVGTLNSLTVTNPITGSVSGNAATATALQTGRTINGITFDGTGNITVPAAAGTLTGGTLSSGVTASSLTSIGTLGTLTVTAPITGSVSGNAATATALQTGRTINGITFDGTGNITVPAAAGTLTGSTLAAGVTASSLTSVGTIGSGVWQGSPIANAYLATGTANTLAGYNNSGVHSGVTVGTGLSLSGGTLTATGSGGTVSTVSVASANGFGGSVANPTTTPAITLTTACNGVCKANGTAISTATAATDYVAPATATNFTAQQNFGTGTLTDASSISWALGANQHGKVMLTGNHALAAATGQIDGGNYTLRIYEDATGGRTLTFDSSYKFPGGIVPNNTTNANAVDLLTCQSDGTNMLCVYAPDIR